MQWFSLRRQCDSFGSVESDTEEVVAAVLAASRLIVGMSARALADVDDSLTLPQLRTLVVLADRPPMKQADLAAELGVNPSTVLRMADRLAAAGLMARQPNPSACAMRLRSCRV